MDWKKTLGALAPTLATALGGPLAGTATKFIAGKLLGDENADDDAIESFITSANPEQLSELKKIDNDFKLEMKRLDIDVFSLEVEDRGSARQNHKHSNTPAILVYMLTGLIAIVTYMLFTSVVPESNENTLYMLLGALTTAWLQSVGYWTGTTRGSAEKSASMFGK